MNNNLTQQNKRKILVADDSAFMIKAVTEALQNDYQIITAENGLRALECIDQHPDAVCIIMGLTMPQMDGLQATRAFKANFKTFHIPIIIMTRKIGPKHMVAAVEAGADDYVKKPFDPIELKARTVMSIRRAERDLSSNPLTKLPGNAIIDRTILSRLDQPLAILYADLDNFKAYNDKYGFNKGDQVLKYTAEILSFAVKNLGNPTDFLGHIGGDDFIIVSNPEKAEALASKICELFDKGVRDFYSEEDMKRKKIIVHDRQGNLCEFPLASISIAIVTSEKHDLSSTPQIAQIAAELKHYAKSKPAGELGSNYVKDRRSK